MLKKILISVFTVTFCLRASCQVPNFQWATAVGNSTVDVAKSIAVDGSGNVYTTGYFTGTVDFDPGPATVNLVASGQTDIYICKLNAVGGLVWAHRVGGLYNDEARSITVDGNADVYITGSFQGTVDFNPSNQVFSMAAPTEDAFVLKLNSGGSFAWAKQISGGVQIESNGIALDGSGNIYTVGSFSGTVDFDPALATAFTISSLGNFDIFVNKLNSSGNFVWVQRFGGTSFDSGRGVSIDPSGNVLTTGHFSGTADFDPGPGTFNMNGSANTTFVSKLSSSGTLVWATYFPGSLSNLGYGIATDISGNVFTTGVFQGTADFDPSNLTSYNLTSAGINDIYISKLDAFGNFSWANKIGGIADDVSWGIALDGSGNVYTVGGFSATIDFDPGAGTYNLSSVGGFDIFVNKLTSSGAFIWSIETGGPNNEFARAITTDASDNIYLVGDFVGTCDFDHTSGTQAYTSNGLQDVFTMKIGQCSPPAAPLNGTTPANLNVCSGSNTTLTATGSGTLNWYSSPTSTAALATGTTYITLPLFTGLYTYYVEAVTCSLSPVRTAVNVTVHALPSIMASSSNTQICSGSSATLSVTGGLTYTWSPGGLGANIVVSPTVNTVYVVTGTDSNSCKKTTSISQEVVDCITGISEADKNLRLKIYPNPTNRLVTIINKELGEYISVYSTFGELLLIEEIKNQETKIDLGTYANGIYFVKIGNSTYKLIKSN